MVLGTSGLGTIVDEETSFRILDRFVEGGGTVLDTANNYAFRLDGATGDESEAVAAVRVAGHGQQEDRFRAGIRGSAGLPEVVRVIGAHRVGETGRSE